MKNRRPDPVIATIAVDQIVRRVFGDRIKARRMRPRGFAHQRRVDRSENLAGPGVDEASLRTSRPQVFQANMRRADIDRQHVLPNRLVARSGFAMNRGNMENEVRAQRIEQGAQLTCSPQVQRTVTEFLRADIVSRILLTRDTGDLVTATQEEFDEIAAVLAVATQNQRAPRGGISHASGRRFFQSAAAILRKLGPPDNAQRRQREDHLGAGHDRIPLAAEELIAKVPWQHQVIIRLHRAGLRLGNDGNIGADGARPVLVWIAVGRAFDQRAVDLTPLQQHVSLGGGAVDVYALAFVPERYEKSFELVAQRQNALLKGQIWRIAIEREPKLGHVQLVQASAG